jgi:putative tryptophan/tyrosine transport system substrate-binding protein
MVKRRQIVVTALAAGAIPASFQLCAQHSKVYRIGFLGNSTAALEANLVEPFRAGLRDLGYVEGRNVVIEYRWAEGDYERLPRLVAELVALKVDVIVTAGTPAALAVQRGAAHTPLVMVAVGDPVGTGLVASLALPGGNGTGLTSIAPDLEGKRLELLSEVVPKLSHVSILLNPANPFHASADRAVHAAGKLLGVQIHSFEVRSARELDHAFEAIAKERPDAFIMLADRVFLHSRTRIVDFAAHNRIPAAYAYRELVEAGGLMSFGPNYADMHRRAATYVHKILRGAKPGDLPVELPTKFELVINVATAKALGLAIPQSVLVRADELIH